MLPNYPLKIPTTQCFILSLPSPLPRLGIIFLLLCPSFKDRILSLIHTNAMRIAEVKQYLWKLKNGRDYKKSEQMRKDFQEKKTDDMGLT